MEMFPGQLSESKWVIDLHQNIMETKKVTIEDWYRGFNDFLDNFLHTQSTELDMYPKIPPFYS